MTENPGQNPYTTPGEGYPQGGYQHGGYPQAGYDWGGYQQGGYQQSGYQQGGYAGQPTYVSNSPQQVEADKSAQLSLVFGIIGLFILGIVFGPLALVQANKAERMGAAATAGKVLGWIATIIGVLGLIFGIFITLVFFSALSTYSSY